MRVPAGIHLIAAAFVLLATGYALAVPAWNHPDEPAHFNYIRHLATRGELPVLEVGAWNAEELAALKATNFRGGPPVGHITYEAHQPPLYYALAVPLYLRTTELPLDRQVLALRLLSVGLGAALVYLVAAVALRAAPGRTDLAALAAGFAAFLPMHTSMAGAINSDALANLLGAALLLASLRAVQRGFGRRDWIVVGVFAGAALLTKATTYALIPLALGALLLGRRATGGDLLRDRLRDVALASGLALLIAGWWFVRNGLTYGWNDLLAAQRHDIVVEGQLRTAEASGEVLGRTAMVLWQSFWGVFGWMGIPLDDQLYLAYGLLVVVAAAGGAFVAARELRQRGWSGLRTGGAGAGVLLVAVALVALALAFYNLRFVQPQGRYLFPALAAIATLMAWGFASLWGREDQPLWRSWAGSSLVFWAVGYLAIEAASAWFGSLPRRGLYPLLTLVALALGLLVQRRTWEVSPALRHGAVLLALAWADLAILVGVVAPAFRE